MNNERIYNKAATGDRRKTIRRFNNIIFEYHDFEYRTTTIIKLGIGCRVQKKKK